MKNGICTTVEITDTHVKVMQGQAYRGSVTVTFCDVQEIREQSDTAISKAISSLMALSKLSAEFTIGVIPRRFAILRHISLPSQTDGEIEKMVNLQIPKQVPYPREDIILDYTVVSKEPNGYSKILVIAVHKEVVGRYLKIFDAANLSVQSLTLSSAGILNWYLFGRNILKEKAAKPVAVINIDSTSSEICFCHNDKLLFSRSINFGARDLTEEKIADFLAEISLTVATYAKQNISQDMGQITLISSSSETALLKNRLEADYNIPVKLLVPLDHLARKKDLKVPFLDQTGVSLAVGSGLLLDTPHKFVNLMPAEVSDKQEVRAKQKEWLRFSVLFLALAVLVVSVFAVRLYKDSAYLSQLTGEIKKNETAVNAVREKIKRLDFIKERMNPGTSVIDVIRELYNITPKEVSFNIVYLDEGGLLNLQGVAETGSAVGVFQRNLVNSPFFQNINLQYVTKRKIFNGELNDFKITCQVGSEKKGTP